MNQKNNISSGSPNDIVSVADSGYGSAEFHTTAAHGLSPLQLVDISGTEIYDGQWEITDVQSPTSFVTAQTYAGSATGTWTLVEI